jgi:hypothetical protein
MYCTHIYAHQSAEYYIYTMNIENVMNYVLECFKFEQTS